MTEVPEKLCACQTSMDNVHGVWLCPHCDQACDVPKPCVTCAWYERDTNKRVTAEQAKEKPQPPIPYAGP